MKSDSFKCHRYLQAWSDDEILRTLEAESRIAHVILWKKWRELGWGGLNGGNVVFIDGSAESTKLNEENEQYMLSQIHREFGLLTISMNLLSREMFNEMVCSFSGTEKVKEVYERINP